MSLSFFYSYWNGLKKDKQIWHACNLVCWSLPAGMADGVLCLVILYQMQFNNYGLHFYNV